MVGALQQVRPRMVIKPEEGPMPSIRRQADETGKPAPQVSAPQSSLHSGRKGTGTFSGLGASTQGDGQTGRKMSQSPGYREKS